ncbi:hypothetical protein, partial [Pseudomonas syringae group genomosp. 7]|uniref:hypothetical protein n=1 Tax=Pseudomonas syringae group genomosp. 7 TaxID=251699 RepID=UPI003770600A
MSAVVGYQCGCFGFFGGLVLGILVFVGGGWVVFCCVVGGCGGFFAGCGGGCGSVGLWGRVWCGVRGGSFGRGVGGVGFG